MGAAGRFKLLRSAPRRCSRDRPEGSRGSVARLIGVCSGATVTALRSVQDRTRRPPQTLLDRAGRGPVLPSGFRVGDQIIPQAADQERPLGDDVRAADGRRSRSTTGLLDVRWMLRSTRQLQAGAAAASSGHLAGRPRWVPPGVNRDRRTPAAVRQRPNSSSRWAKTSRGSRSGQSCSTGPRSPAAIGADRNVPRPWSTGRCGSVTANKAVRVVCHVLCLIWSASAPPMTAPQVVQTGMPSRSR